MFLYRGSSDRIVTMTTTDPIIKLPAGYEDWVESGYPGAANERLRVMFDHFPGEGFGSGKQVLWFAPPKPKPVLPDVTPGAVIRYVDVLGRECRAVKLEGDCRNSWRVFTSRKTGADSIELTDDELLNDVDADGFTVELEGL